MTCQCKRRSKWWVGMDRRSVFLVSDGTGITAEILSHSLLTQFPGFDFSITTMPYVNTPERAELARSKLEVAAADDAVEPLVFTTFADESLHDVVVSGPGAFFDFFEAFIGPLERVLGVASSHTRGQTHGLVDVEQYTSRISAIDYAMHCDDGINVVNYDAADLLLVGVSRSGKTPTCLYMALHYSLRAANYPLLEEDLDRDVLPERLQTMRDKLFGLTIEPGRLQQIRQERRPNSEYSRLLRCRREVRAAEAMFKAERIPFVDVTSMSIEEISTTILDSRGLHRSFF